MEVMASYKNSLTKIAVKIKTEIYLNIISKFIKKTALCYATTMDSAVFKQHYKWRNCDILS